MGEYRIKFEIIFRSGAQTNFESSSTFASKEDAQEVVDENIMTFHQIMCSTDAHEGVKIDNRIIQVLDVSMINQIIIDRTVYDRNRY